MLAIFGKKKVTDDKVSLHFVHTTLEVVESGWPEVAGFINDSPEFIKRPDLDPDDFGRFLMIVIAGNFNYIPKYFEDGHDKEIIKGCVEQYAKIFDIRPEEFALKVKKYREFLARVNMPSKNTLYSMSRGIFHKYDLNCYQEEYFASLNTPNPIFLKNMNEIMVNFLWDWSAFKEKYKVV
ncbi:hypothetical protein [Sanyastnella coralliicola]|uniref:hypothetical protein n=1 Tax=Sanyastnella coralliicola TaxID=3069118 RepID=UPI0027B95147|nr:hypothetical protein [Longitalea sp. SCSIO 12813]